ncbi:bifunctional 3-(3-hydroxy-phenyl)propionate/3-hydroxycinnamic acid hydroxylase [Agromyces aerolatus]|uniref:bifunctional 3-(3-hydroxy-phenyl)propionate/3-hydroxycinnamic acid hydroxylase n=1 Tax=Agromyces sp. LY-1074 TaxID=3074080 RepID=UPI0028548B30|nr:MULTISPECIES: bifunctional 3-(3-hydroxy-phenyl)propionate/3-hydroxycinnamic acid hydroxylase [unclassified Agromyces]MDR5699430.1 bifunctional 3-(3-hydroxy-phenyl)propionate/3-hydroxycinnamic acid hydroxylase [Agromyces sp. LY-1074]MDR5705726.1 bifunctional 3-(3-hydroxy-phenyl)propionate/3-hydroxycinnamic acid hydroxylase [Agromyces sp. LY-1358]
MTHPSARELREADVTIVGAGPVGLSIANLLGLRGVRVNVVEALPDLIDYPRGVGIDDESLRSIQTMGLIQDVLPHTTPNHIMRLVNGRGRILAEIAPAAVEFGWSRRNAFVQPAVDRALYDGLSRFPHVAVDFDRRAAAIVDHGSHVDVTVHTGDHEEITYRSAYLVGADGGRSLTRKHLGVGFDGQSPSTRWIVIDMENDPLGAPNVFVGGDPRRPYVSLALPHALRRFEFMLFDDEPDELAADDAFIARLLAPHLPNPKQVAVLRRRVYTHHSRIASTFRQGRILLAGDAAHLMPVWQGQGWNSGMRDSTNLAWKLAAVVRGESEDALLDTYTVERRPHAKAMIDISVAFGRFIRPTNRLVAALRDSAASTLALVPSIKSYFVQMKYKPMPRYTRGVVVDPIDHTPGAARAELRGKGLLTSFRSFTGVPSPVGTQFIQPTVRTVEGDEVRLDDLIGYRWAVLVWGGDPHAHLSPEARELVRRLDAAVISLRPVTQLVGATSPGTVVAGDVDGRIKRWFDQRPTAALVLRPDRFIAAAGTAQNVGRMLHAVAAAAHLRPESPETPAPSAPVRPAVATRTHRRTPVRKAAVK